MVRMFFSSDKLKYPVHLHRPSGEQQQVQVQLEVTNADGPSQTLKAFYGTLLVPTGNPNIVNVLVEWNTLPYFSVNSTGTVSSTQAIRLALQTESPIDESFSILSFRFAFYTEV